MIELEIQGLSASREGLLVEVGRLVLAAGFTLQRQRLLQDPHGMLLTVVVSGPARKRRALDSLLDACERLISFQVEPLVEGDPRPHFAATLKRSNYTPAPRPTEAAPLDAPAVALAPVVVAAAVAPPPLAVAGRPTMSAPTAVPAPKLELSAEPDFEFIQPTVRAVVPAPAAVTPVDDAAYVDRVALDPDEAAVARAVQSLEYDYPAIVPKLLALQGAVAQAACDSSLALAGRRTGDWVFLREYALDIGLDVNEAIGRIGAPALRALVEVKQNGAQLHILDSPLCAPSGHSGCSFYSGFLEGVLGPAVAPGSVSIFPVCCRSYGADECVLAISD